MEFRDPGAMLSATHELDDGSRVRLRLTRPTDLARIADLLGGEVAARRFAFYDPRERVAIAATRPGTGGEEIVGVAEVDSAARGVRVVAPRHVGLRRLLDDAARALAQHRDRHVA